MKQALIKLGVPLGLTLPALYFSYEYAVLAGLVFVALYMILYSEVL